MLRFLGCFSVFLLICGACVGQSPAPPIAFAPTDIGPATQQFQKIEDSWSESVNNRDQYGLELILSPLFVDVSASGDVTTRNQQVAQVIAGEDKTLHLEQKVVTVRLLGDIAVANGTYTLHHKMNTAEANDKGIFTQVFERSHGGWLCINSQRTLLREDSNAKQKKASNAELPFHIPLFSKSDKESQ